VTFGSEKNVHQPVRLMSSSGRIEEISRPNVGIVQSTTSAQTVIRPSVVASASDAFVANRTVPVLARARSGSGSASVVTAIS
jgi:hypothetical protein